MTGRDVGRARRRVALAVVTLAGACALACDPAVAGPADTAVEFVRSVQRGDLEHAKRLLDDVEFRVSPTHGGDDGYFVYQSAYEPNLAFLVGHPFVVGSADVTTQQSDWYVLDGTLYATAAIPLRFTADRYQPWVLPPPLAFGRSMRLADFMTFVAAPGHQPENLTLRIRASLERGGITPPAARSVAAPPAPAPPGSRPVTLRPDPAGAFGSLFGPTVTDPGPVILPSGEVLAAAQLGRLLPKLTALTLHVHLVRRGRLASWAVSRWTITDAVLLGDGRETPIGVGSGGATRGQ